MFDFLKPVSEAQKRKVRIHRAERSADYHFDEAARLHELAEVAKTEAEGHCLLMQMYQRRVAELRSQGQ